LQLNEPLADRPVIRHIGHVGGNVWVANFIRDVSTIHSDDFPVDLDRQAIEQLGNRLRVAAIEAGAQCCPGDGSVHCTGIEEIETKALGK
jgi:hypothetical protein